MTNIMKMVKQAQQMQAKMAKMEEELGREEFDVSTGGGAGGAAARYAGCPAAGSGAGRPCCVAA